MLSGFLFPQCVQPVYWMDDVHTADRCGWQNGILYACLLSLLGFIVLIGHRWKASWTTKTVGTGSSVEQSSFPILLFVIGYLVTVWSFVPLLFRLASIAQWKGYQTAIQNLMDKYSMTRLEAINTVASWHSGTLDAGSTSIISASALLGSSRNSHPQACASTPSTPIPSDQHT
jgi:hypothetical protein